MNTWIEGPSPREKRGMGCVGKGCLILACFIVFLIIAGAIGVYFGTRTYSALLHGFSWANKTHVLAQEPSPVPQFETSDDSGLLLAASINRLPHEQREVLVMKIWNELTFAEIGEALGISQNTAASRYRYALAALKEDLLQQ